MRTLHKTLNGAIEYLKAEGWEFHDGFWWKDAPGPALALAWDHNLKMWQLTPAI